MSSPFTGEQPDEIDGSMPAATSQSIPTTVAPSTSPRVVYFGTQSLFSRPPLHRLLAEAIEVVAVVVPGRGGAPVIEWLPPAWARNALPLAGNARGVLETAWERDIPVLEVGDLAHPRTLEALEALAPDVLAVACFPLRVPASVLALPTLGAVNLHPSLLPRHRGPNPIFWALRDDDPLGVSVHLMTEQLDRGPVLAREVVHAPDGRTSAELDVLHASVGADLMVRAIRELAAGSARPATQDEALASYERWPEPEHFVVPTGWVARRAFNFIRGVSDIGVPVIEIGGRRLQVRAAIGYEADAEMAGDYEHRDGTARVQFSPGILEVVLTED